MLSIRGNIPAEVTYIYDNEQKAYVTDNDSPTTVKKIEENQGRETLVCKNVPMNNICLNESLGEGVYSATVSASGTDKILDMRVQFQCDRFINEVIKDGMSKGGKLNGSFLWGTIDNKVKLILKDSEIYSKIKSYSQRKIMKPISNNELQIGGVYCDKQEKRYVFLGRVDTNRYTYKKKPCKTDKYGYVYSFFKETVIDGILFAKVSENLKTENIQKNMDSFDKNCSSLHFYVQNTHSFIYQIGIVTVPDDIIYQVKDFKTKESIICFRPMDGFTPSHQNNNLSRYCFISDLAHMSPHGNGPLPPYAKVYNMIEERLST
jgi:hypothetical protein